MAAELCAANTVQTLSIDLRHAALSTTRVRQCAAARVCATHPLVAPAQVPVQARAKATISVNALVFKDLNANGRVDDYEGWRLPVAARVRDLSSGIIPVEQTWDARLRAGIVPGATSLIVSVDVATGARREETTGPGLKVEPQFVGAANIGYLIKAGSTADLKYTASGGAFPRAVRSPSWSPDGRQVVYEKVEFKPRAQNLPLYSWSADYEYRCTDVFPTVASDGKLVVTEKALSDGAISIMDADGANKQRIFTAGSGAAFAPAWSPDGLWIAFGLGGYLQARKSQPATSMIVRRDGTGARELTPDSLNAGFPSWSPDGKRIVYRICGGATEGLRIINVTDGSVQVFTTEYDNLSCWSPDGSLVAFTRKHEGSNFDIYTIRPDGSDLRQLTTTPANDAHAVWTSDSKHLLWNSGIYGFKDEAALYDNTFQPYGGIFIINADGTDKRHLTDSPWPVFSRRHARFLPGNPARP